MPLLTELDGHDADAALAQTALVASSDEAASCPPGTVVVGGVRRPMRASFEADFFDGHTAEVLASRYPGIARAYSAAQWDAVFGPTLGAGEAFGAGS